MMTQLLGHQERVSLATLAEVPTPEPTKTWRPVPHINVVKRLLEGVEPALYDGDRARGTLEIGLSPNGKRMFGVMQLSHERVLGFRNAHDKAFALGITAGIQVMVCSNLCFGGEITLSRKHTSKLDLSAEVDKAFSLLGLHFAAIEDRRAQLQQTICSKDGALHLACQAAEARWLRPCDIYNVVQEFVEPRHVEHLSGHRHTRWTLHNAFTEVIKKYSAARFDEAHRGVAKLFQVGV